MVTHPIDFEIQSSVYSTPELGALFSERQRFSRWLQIEAALARAQSDLGIIPVQAAQQIILKAEIEALDLEKLQENYRRSGNSLVPLLQEFRRVCGPQAGEYVHNGATTQDILDTSQILELRDFFNHLYPQLRRLEEILLGIAGEHRATPMIGRTHGQQALPITFGFKVAGWLQEIRRHIERLKNLAARVIVGQLGGAVGTLAAFGPRAFEVVRKTMDNLGLPKASLSWHNSRDNCAEVASFLAIQTGTMARIANEIFQLQKTEIGELAESVPSQQASSSCMPHKRNPVLCQRIAVLNSHVRALAAVVTENMIHEHERDPRALWSEWLAMPQICIYSGTALEKTIELLGGMRIYPENMMFNLLRQKEVICSEWLVSRLSGKIGKLKAQEKLHQLIIESASSDYSLREILAADEDIGYHLTSDDFEYFDHPENNIGFAVELVDVTVDEIWAYRKSDPARLSP